jgi:cytidylate kinase
MIVTISRQVATNGSLIGRLVAARLGLRFFDRELVDEIARRLEVDPNIVTHFDEASLNPVESALWEWRSSVNERVYLRSLRQALQRIAREDNAVIIGRGANFILRCPNCLHVRIVAPTDLRVAIYRATHDVSEKDALREITQENNGRSHFVRTHFGLDINDPENYDLVVNLAGLAPEMTAELIAHAARIRVSQRIPMEPEATLPQHIEIMTRHRRPVRPEVIEREERKL